MRRMKKYRILIILMLLALCIPVSGSYAQVLSTMQNNFIASQKENLREKIFMHINKSFYVAGEILWFKIYCTDGSTNKPLNLSKIAYVELVDENHNAVVQSMVELNNGTGNGSLYLPFSLNNGHYVIRSYTSWMKNFDSGYFFEGRIDIANPRKLAAEAKLTPLEYDVHFFPEGGHLVQSLSNKMAFKITGSDGKGVACTGAIITNQGDTVVKFSTLKFGIGSFTVKPNANETYKAVIKISDQTLTRDLPQIYQSGYVMKVMDDNNKLNVSIQNSDSLSIQPAYILVHNNYAIEQADEIHLAKGLGNISIEKSKLNEGISYITLFDEQRKPLCERLVFKRPARKLLIRAQADKQSYNTRKKITLALSASNEINAFTAANLSVSVFRADDLQNKSPDHINGYLWLRADLKGRIESPDYYLDNNDKEANEALDNLLISQGWTQFDWNSVSAGSAFKIKFLPEYTGPIVTGHVTNATSNERVAGITAYLTINGSPQQFHIAQSDSTGRILFNTQNFYGLHEMVAQTNTKTDSSYHIDIQSPFAERDTTIRFKTLIFSQDIKKTLAENSLNMQVQNIFATEQIKQFDKPVTDSSWFYGKPTKTYKLDDYTRFTTMEEVLREYVGSITVAKHQGKFIIHAYNGEQLLGEPLILLDGIPVFDADKLFKWDPLRIKALDVVTQNYIYGPTLFSGITSFTTYKGDGSNIELDSHAIILDYEGLQQQRKFYAPVYDSEEQISSTLPDFRTALYWNPKVNTDSGEKTSLTFYTSDKIGQYIGIIEGNTADGRCGSGVFTFEVKK